MKKERTFIQLVESIKQIHDQMARQASKAVNISLTLRNWGIGYYIYAYEQNGSDRAKYGEHLLEDLSDKLKETGMNRTAARELRRYRKFYLTYPQIWESLTPELQALLPFEGEACNSGRGDLKVPGAMLLEKLSFTHLAELIKFDDPLKRVFYEVECIRGNWSVRELKRQMGSLYFERCGLSKDKKKLAKMVMDGAENAQPEHTVRDPYVFEFLGLRPEAVIGESKLEDALLDRLQEFLLELGLGFCFEARQKRILIGDQHYFIDLVFYHRILKCHILVELKSENFSHEQIGQLNTYVTWFKRNMMTKGDNQPVGLLLCTNKDNTLVEYALGGMDNRLFVSNYQLELPDKKKIQKFIEELLRKELGQTGDSEN